MTFGPAPSAAATPPLCFCEASGDRLRILAGDQHVDVRHAVAASPQRSRRGDALDSRELLQVADELLRERKRHAERCSLRLLRRPVDRLAEVQDRLMTQAGQAGDAVRVQVLPEILQ